MPRAVRTLSWRHCFVPTFTAALVNCDPREPSTEAPPEGSVPWTTRQCHHLSIAACLPSPLWPSPAPAPATSTATMRYGRWGSFSRGLPHQKIWHNPLVLLELPTHSRANCMQVYHWSTSRSSFSSIYIMLSVTSSTYS